MAKKSKSPTNHICSNEIDYKNIIQHMGMGLVVLHRDDKNILRVVDANPAALKMMSNFSGKPTGYDLSRLISFFQCNKLRQQIQNIALENGEKYSFVPVCKCSRKFGSCFTLRSFLIPDRGVGIILEDVSERKELENKLVQAQKLESVAALAGGIAHDFNNLLSGMYGYMELVKQSIENDNGEKTGFYLDRVFGVHDRAKSLALQLLSISRKKESTMQLSAVRPMLLEAVLFSFSGSRIRCEQDISENLHNAVMDSNQIHQVVQNLIINAQQAIKEDGVIKIHARNIEIDEAVRIGLRPIPYVYITVKDSGPGIPREHIDRLFDPFFTTKKEGTGLGLHVCKSIIEKHEGIIRVSSKQNSGAEFTIYLPACLENITQKFIETGKAPTSGGRVLVMDDEEFILEIAGEMLEMLGYEPVLVPDGKDALKEYKESLLSDNPIDILILDLTIRGGVGGLETINKLKAVNPQVKALLSTGYTQSDVIEDYKRFGFSGVINKPYVVKDLQKALSSLNELS